jgi:hypothetical protein
VGVKVTLIAQLAPAAKELPHVLLWEKSPVMEIFEIVSVVVPLLVNVTDCAVLGVPTN